MKILFLAANPKEMKRLDLDKEARTIELELAPNKFEFEQKWAVRLNILQKTLLTTKPNLVHISGHGSGKSGLVFVDESRNPETASGEALADLFALIPSVKCVLLNSCYTEVQAKAIARHINYVIGMKDEVLESSGDRFFQGILYCFR